MTDNSILNSNSNDLTSHKRYKYNLNAVDRLKKIYFMDKYNIKDEEFDGRSFEQIFNESKKVMSNSGDLITSCLIISVFIYLYASFGWDEFIQTAKNDFDNLKCDPRYIFINGYIKPVDNKDGFESTGDYFQECLEPLAQESAEKKSYPSMALLSSNTDFVSSMPTSMSLNMTSVNDFTDNILNLKQTQQKEDDKNSSQKSITTYYTLDVVQKFNALNQGMESIFTGLNISVQSGMVYIYDFFGGALVEFSVLITVFIVAAVAAQAMTLGVPNPLSATFLAIAFIFLMIFVAVLCIMLTYRSLLVSVFGINPDKEIK